MANKTLKICDLCGHGIERNTHNLENPSKDEFISTFVLQRADTIESHASYFENLLTIDICNKCINENTDLHDNAMLEANYGSLKNVETIRMITNVMDKIIDPSLRDEKETKQQKITNELTLKELKLIHATVHDQIHDDKTNELANKLEHMANDKELIEKGK